jgi:Predicted integral membrane protein
MEIRMLAFALPYTLHVLAALVWVGGMFFAWLVLRPATVAALEGPARLRLWVEVFRRFFVWVWLAVAILAISGIGMLHMRFSGFETAPKYVHVMIGGGIAMFALFMRIQALLLPELKAAVQAEDWPGGRCSVGADSADGGDQPAAGLAVVDDRQFSVVGLRGSALDFQRL